MIRLIESLLNPIQRERLIYDYYFWLLLEELFLQISSFLDKANSKHVSFKLRRKIDELYKLSSRAVRFGRPLNLKQYSYIEKLQLSGISDRDIRRLSVGRYIQEEFIRKRSSIDVVIEILGFLMIMLCLVSVTYLTLLNCI